MSLRHNNHLRQGLIQRNGRNMTEMSAQGFNITQVKQNYEIQLSSRLTENSLERNLIYQMCVTETMFGKIRHRFRGNSGFSRKYDKFINI